ncbi:hypothetical protein [Streptomyces sp. NPDC059649]|uniref:hypothetical protein n=1 Tax=Streptomyces sp. NPDC059649 TaxID=3346895 RepID=UPI0036A05DEA
MPKDPVTSGNAAVGVFAYVQAYAARTEVGVRLTTVSFASPHTTGGWWISTGDLVVDFVLVDLVGVLTDVWTVEVAAGV